MDLDFFSSPNHRKSYFFGFKHIKTQKWTQWVLLEKVISHPQPSHTQTETQTVEANHLLDHWGINKPHLFYISPPPQLLVIIFSPFHPLFVLDFPLTPSSLQLPSLFFADSLQLMPQKNKPNYKTAITGTTAKRSKVVAPCQQREKTAFPPADINLVWKGIGQSGRVKVGSRSQIIYQSEWLPKHLNAILNCRWIKGWIDGRLLCKNVIRLVYRKTNIYISINILKFLVILAFEKFYLVIKDN